VGSGGDSGLTFLTHVVVDDSVNCRQKSSIFHSRFFTPGFHSLINPNRETTTPSNMPRAVTPATASDLSPKGVERVFNPEQITQINAVLDGMECVGKRRVFSIWQKQNRNLKTPAPKVRASSDEPRRKSKAFCL